MEVSSTLVQPQTFTKTRKKSGERNGKMQGREIQIIFPQNYTAQNESFMKGKTTQIPVQFFWEKECWGKVSKLHLERSTKNTGLSLHSGRGYYVP